MAKYIIPFNDIRKTDVLSAGGKGANLGEMASNGMPVPEGGVLCAEAYDLFIERNGIDVNSVLKSSSTEKEASEKLKSLILSAEIPNEIKSEVIGFYGSLGENARVAVRSSATAEDLEDASFAGQQETHLNVRTEKTLLEKIKECYASLWGVRAIHYRNESGYGNGKVSLAVVIQRMIESESAGVIFTKDPAGGTDNIIINASYGLDEAVVSRIVSPNEYICDRSGNLKNTVLGSKECKIVYSENGTEKVPVGEVERKSRVLNDKMIKALADEALRIENHYGHPIDIEWAVKDGRVYILQARAITTLSDKKAPVFTDEDFAELPEAKPATGRMRASILFNLEKLPKPYFPLDYDFADIIGDQKRVLLGEVGIIMPPSTQINDNGISYFNMGSKVHLNGNIRHFFRTVRQMKNEDKNTAKADNELEACRSELEKLKNKEHHTSAELGKTLYSLRELIRRTAYARFRYAIFPQVLENKTLNKSLAKIGSSLNSFDLMEGLSYVTADIDRSIAALAADIRRSPDKLEAVMTLSYKEMTEKYPDLKALFSDFMEKYGNRCDFNCYCFTSKSWNDGPDRFLHSLRTALRRNDKGAPSLENSRKKYNELLRRAKNTLGAKEYRVFEKKASTVRHYHYIREATQYIWESEFSLCRKLLRETADMLCADYDDLLYLFANELFDICKAGKVTERYRELIQKRKEKRPLAEAYWSRSIGIMLDTGSLDITGVCGSGGKATGKACIVNGPEEFGKLMEGDILVCPYTDPEWTPLFTLAAGVVVDTGGTLSHAAIVAREYKIPAVLAVGNATSKINDGDTVMVDGDNGKVVVI